ncbi:MAG: tRNA glutamyl-Q(34) synthetase GluQRS, partial [Eggerthellaceae bacterium]|nr:tRNA glutamyl-Q(34) synthetase GluQRS [Eggerthellaceae bacterium]
SESGPTGRFAPSPTGRMHAGNVFAALIAWLDVRSRQGKIVLRIEDLDAQRSRPEYSDALLRDLDYLGLSWDEGPFFQSEGVGRYQEALSQLEHNGLLYPCFCTRAGLLAASAPHGSEPPVYPGTCRSLSPAERFAKAHGHDAAIRVIVPDETICFEDALQGAYAQRLCEECGDFIVRRSDGGFAYQLAVVVDDAWQGVDSVVRACDLIGSTPRQIYLQRLLGMRHPEYCHIPLLVDGDGRRLSKRQKDANLDALSARFKSPEGLIGYIAGLAGLVPPGEAISAEGLIRAYTRDALKGVKSIVVPL